jgi:hypothetical protein
MCDEDEDFVPSVDEPVSYQPFTPRMEEGGMNAFRDSIAEALMVMGEQEGFVWIVYFVKCNL